MRPANGRARDWIFGSKENFLEIALEDSPPGTLHEVTGFQSNYKDEQEVAERTRLTKTIDTIVTRMNAALPKPMVFKIDITPYREEKGFGADWHTSQRGHERIGNEIAEAVAKVWSTP